MIPDQWYAILESTEVRPGRPVGVNRMGERLVLWRDSRGAVACLREPCPHRGAALSLGRVAGDRVECPFHGFQFEPGGACRLIPANGRGSLVPKAFEAQAYPVREGHGFIWLWWGEPRADLPPLQFFESLDASFSGATIRDEWPVHYSRAIENQLDVVHLPFVHRTTIGRGGRTLADGPQMRLTGDLMEIWVNNRQDDGSPPRRAEAIPESTQHPLLQFRFPNTWHNWLGDDVRIIAAFAPVDDERTVLYVRFCQRRVRLPLLRDAFNAAAMPLNRVILDQDKRVVLSQRPTRSELRMGEKLIPGDGPIVAYRRRRQELIEAALR